MKTHLSRLLVLLFLGLELAFAAGCANTGRGIERDYQHAEDKVESLGK